MLRPPCCVQSSSSKRLYRGLQRCAQIAMMFLVRHEAYHNSLWTAWLDSVDGLLPAAAVQEACCGRGRWRQQQRRQQFRRRSARVRWS